MTRWKSAYVRELQERAVCQLFGLDYEEMKPEFEEEMRELDRELGARYRSGISPP